MTNLKRAADKFLASAAILEFPDRFNEAFAGRGWIATGSFSLDAMRKAVDLHEEGKLEEAEDAILEWFTEDNIRLFAITRAYRFHVAKLRDAQLEEALRLYLEGRYIAAVPLILIACDGFASDVCGISPFEKNADLNCFDSITGHRTSLPALMKLFVQGVRKSTDEELSIPKRHGILHGRSLGYANRLVCAKAWLLMVALVDWAIDKSSEAARMEERERKEKASWRNSMDQYSRVLEDKKKICEFRPTETSGPLAGSHESDSAEHAAQEFLEGWSARNFGRMAKYAVNLTKKPFKAMAGEMRDMAEFVVLNTCEVVAIRHSTVARCDMRVRIQATVREKLVIGEFNVILFRNNAEGNIAMPTDQDCTWAVQQRIIYDVMHERFAEEA
ncbi:hypothetical protein EV147_3912 [Cupriavidus agavae]|uniref:Uncharacterized protein n=2 Tax=Cupriavidus agavae TaxID=1001822 RepID=A0A4Q7RRQ0_9BURK|nr:hypothetical protein EV147_3912 [Cupriavidus agavae]